MTRKKKTLAVVSLVLLLVSGGIYVLNELTWSKRTIYTCILCRLEWTQRTTWRGTQDTYADTAFTPWYQQHRPAHDHVWSRYSDTKISGLLRQGYASGYRHRVCVIDPEWMLTYAEQASRDELDAFFAGIQSADQEVQEQTVDQALDRIYKLR
jgi:hypothetical protein